eukprot:487832-Pelagomonas_calceolata.AAC.4
MVRRKSARRGHLIWVVLEQVTSFGWWALGCEVEARRASKVASTSKCTTVLFLNFGKPWFHVCPKTAISEISISCFPR